MAYRRDIDGLRSLAVIPVIFNHSGLAFSGGFIGVDIFFVISGFLITGILIREIDDDRFSILNFYERRARRILPALVCLLLIVLAAGFIFLLPDEYVLLAKSSIATLLFSSNIWFWSSIGDYFSNDVMFEPLLHTWSLAVEEQFYLFFPLLLAFLAKRKRVWFAVVGAISLASFMLSVWATGAMPTANFYLAPTRIWELGIGALVAIGIAPKIEGRAVTEIVSGVGLALILLGIFLITDETPFPGIAALPPCLGAAAIIWAGARRQTVVSRMLAITPLVWTGLISYSLYLWHWPILVGARLYVGGAALPAGLAAACLALSVLCAWLSWKYVEQPFRRPNTGLKLSQRKIFQASGLSTGLVAVICAGLIASNGAPSRLNGDAVSAYQDAQARSPLDEVCLNVEIGAPPCHLGMEPVDGSVDYVVWGDSHAAAMLPGFDLWMRQRNLAGAAFTKTACAPLIGIRRTDQDNSHRCDDQNRAAVDYIKANYPDATVIIAARWALATEGERAIGESGKAAVLARTGEPPLGDMRSW